MPPKRFVAQVGQEVKPLQLVRAELRRHAGGQVGGDAGLDLAGPPLDLFHLRLRQELPRGVMRQLQRMQALRLRRKFVGAQPQARQSFVLLRRQVVGEAPPAFAFQPDEAALRVEQQPDLLLA